MEFHTIATDVGFTEGPVFTQAGDIVFTSIDRGRVYTVRDGETSTLGLTGAGPNGATEGADGSIYVAQNGGQFPAHRWPGVTGGVQAISPKAWFGPSRPTRASRMISASDPTDSCMSPTRAAARDGTTAGCGGSMSPQANPSS